MVKELIKKTISFFYSFYFSFNKRISLKDSSLIFIKVLVDFENQLILHKANLYKSTIDINGKENKILIMGKLANSSICVSGSNNRVIISQLVAADSLNLILRGDNCICYIGKATTFGGTRIVCMGKNNSIIIGEECMFSDNIEIWATDSHPIFDKKNCIINISKPIKIEDHVWVGAHAILLKGIHIAEGAIIGMGSIVTKDIQPHSINVGNPCQCIKQNIASWNRDYITI